MWERGIAGRLHCQPALDEILFEENRLIVFNEALEAFRVSQKDDSLKKCGNTMFEFFRSIKSPKKLCAT
jgi:hypothetical protein